MSMYKSQAEHWMEIAIYKEYLFSISEFICSNEHSLDNVYSTHCLRNLYILTSPPPHLAAYK